MSLRVENVSKGFEGKQVLNEITFEVSGNGITTFIGKSGSGKTTLLNLISLFDHLDRGTIFWGDTCLTDLSEAEKDRYRGGLFSFIFQEYNLFEDLTVHENLVLCSLKPLSETAIIDALKEVEMDGFLETQVKKLSGGERQRVTIARALIRDTPIVIADEPTGNLDEVTGEHIMELLKRISKTKIVILVTHNNEFASKYSDTLYSIEHGNIRLLTSQKPITQEDFKYVNHSVKQKPTYKGILPFLFKNPKNSKPKTIISVIIVSFFLIVDILLFGLSTTDITNEYLKSIHNDGLDFSYLVNDESREIGLYTLYSNEESYKDKGIYPYYMYECQIPDGVCYFSIIVDSSIREEISGNKIVISDFLADILIAEGYFAGIIDRNELIGKEIMIYDDSFLISDIFVTGYESDPTITEYDEKFFSSVYMSKDNFFRLFDNIENFSIRMANIDGYFGTVSFIKDESLDGNKVKISQNLSPYLPFGENTLSSSRQFPYENVQFKVNVLSVSFESDDNTVLVGNAFFDSLLLHYLGGGIIVDLDETPNAFFTKSASKNIFVYSDQYGKYEQLLFLSRIVRWPTLIFTLLSFFLTFLIAKAFLIQRFEHNIREYIILRGHGKQYFVNRILQVDILLFYGFTVAISAAALVCLNEFLIRHLAFLLNGFSLSVLIPTILISITYLGALSITYLLFVRKLIYLEYNRLREFS